MTVFQYQPIEPPHPSRPESGERDDIENQYIENRDRPIERWTERMWRLAALPMLVFFILPILVLFSYSSFSELIKSLEDPGVRNAIMVSLRTTFLSLFLIILFGTPLAYLLGRHRFPLHRAVDALVSLPTVLPPSTAGVALLLALGRQSTMGGFLADIGLPLSFTSGAVILAQVFIAAPYFITAAALGFASVDNELIQAAHLDGANSWQAFRFIVYPISRVALISGAVLSWSRALGEFGATIIFAGNFPGRTQTMPMAIYLGFESNLTNAITLSIILILISFGALLVVKSLVSRAAQP
jgi:molybdate transport system permease protein